MRSLSSAGWDPLFLVVPVLISVLVVWIGVGRFDVGGLLSGAIIGAGAIIGRRLHRQRTREARHRSS